jgi:hypothetical protein
VEKEECIQEACVEMPIEFEMRFTDGLTWNWEMYKTDSEAGKKAVNKIKKAMAEFYSNDSVEVTEDNIIVNKLRKGSVIADITVQYDYVDADQALALVDAVTDGKGLNGLKVDTVKTTVPKMKCEAPNQLKGEVLSVTEFNITWNASDCVNDLFMFLFYKESTPMKASASWNGHRNWTVRPISKNATHVVIKGLVPSVKYKAYILTASHDGNGPISEIVYLSAPFAKPDGIVVNLKAKPMTSGFAKGADK